MHLLKIAVLVAVLQLVVSTTAWAHGGAGSGSALSTPAFSVSSPLVTIRMEYGNLGS